MATKKVGSSGRYGVRYGRKPKMAIKNIEAKQRKKQECPYCERSAIKRVASGIWKCNKCSAKFAGAAYSPKSSIKVTIGEVEEEFHIQEEEPKTEETTAEEVTEKVTEEPKEEVITEEVTKEPEEVVTEEIDEEPAEETQEEE